MADKFYSIVLCALWYINIVHCQIEIPSLTARSIDFHTSGLLILAHIFLVKYNNSPIDITKNKIDKLQVLLKFFNNV